MTNAEGALAAALDRLAALGTDQDREQIAALRARLDAARLRVLVAGEAKRGKSTLINALLGRAVLPAGVTPLTAVATTVRYGDDPRAEVRFADGHEEKQPLTAPPDLVTERGNPGNRRHVAAAEIERQGRERLVGLTVAAASAWRARRRDIIEQGLARTDARLAADLTAALGELRDSAAELLGLELLVPEPGGQRPSVSPCRTAGGARRRRSRSAGCTWRSAHHAPGRRT
jgi:hypothetical protein